MSLTSKRIYEFGEFRLRVSARLLERAGEPVPLGSKAFEVLTCLVLHAGSLVTKDTLLKTVWPESFVEEGNLSQQIFALRRALGDQAGFIVTIPGRGYQFTERVRELADLPKPLLVDSGTFLLQRTRERTHIVIEETSRHADTTVPMPATSPTSTPDRDSANIASHGQAAGRELEIEGTADQPICSSPFMTDGAQPIWGEQVAALQRRTRARKVWVWTGALAGLLLVGGCVFVLHRLLRVPTNQRVVIAELENRTQDPDLNGVLQKALEIDLDQSPYIDVMGEPEALSTLKLMGRKAETPFVPVVAREVCQRSNRQVLIAGSIARLGQGYLLMLEATECASGKIVAGTQVEVDGKDQMLAALDSASASLRKSLGESAESLERFQVPIAQATTASLDALEQYSIGEYLLGRRGREESDVLPFFQRAVELDPQFAMAQIAVATGYYRLGEYTLAAPYYERAFDLSGRVSEKERLYIRAHYYCDRQRDVRQGLRAYQMWAETYPRDWGPWVDMADGYSQLGKYPEAVGAAERALKLDSSRGIIYGVLAQAYMHLGRYSDARSIAAQANSLGKDPKLLHATLLEIALAQNDEPGIAREAAWSHGKEGEWDFLNLQALAAAQHGRYGAASELFQQAYDSAIGEGLLEKANDILIDQASAYFELGLSGAARDVLRLSVSKQSINPRAAYLRAQLNDETGITRSRVAYSGAKESLLAYDSPRIRARLALNQRKPLEALEELQTVDDAEAPDGYSTTIERADAYLMAKRPTQAVDEYRRILDNPGVDPLSPLIPLAYLGLARAESQAGLIRKSKADYEALFSEWRQADGDLPVLLIARREYRALTAVQ